MTDELTRALLLEEVASRETVAAALHASVTGDVPLVQALLDTKAVTPAMLARYLSRTPAPLLQKVVPLLEVVERLPPGLGARLLALPVRRDAITGTVDVVVVDANDPHPAREIAFHLGAPVRLVRAPLAAIEDALHLLRTRSLPPPAPAPVPARPLTQELPRTQELARPAMVVPPFPPPPKLTDDDDEQLYDSRASFAAPARPSQGPSSSHPFRGNTLPPADPALRLPPSQLMLDTASAEALRPSRVPAAPSHRQAHVLPGFSKAQRPTVTPPWGTEVHPASAPASASSGPSSTKSDAPRSGLGSEIPIPLTRRTFAAVSGGTQRPPPFVDPRNALGEGYAVDTSHFRSIVELTEPSRIAHPSATPDTPPVVPVVPVDLPPLRAAEASFIPGPPPVPSEGPFTAFAAQVAQAADIGGILAALRAAGSRDEVLELVLTGARAVAHKVGIFVVKRGGYLGWACTPEFGDRAALQAVLIPLETPSVFDEAVRDGLYLGPLRRDEVHASLLDVMRGASRDVAAVPIRVSGKTAVVLLADELGDTMLATRRLEELARAAGEAFARIVRMRR